MAESLKTVTEQSQTDAIARFISLAFTPPPDQAAKWLKESVGLDNCRFLADPHGRPAASLVRVPMGQYFGGRSVPMLGIAGVAVPPENRGVGCAGRMMRACIRDGASEGFPISTLYASTAALYRSVGYEVAGARFEMQVDTRSIIHFREKGRTVAPLDESHTLEVHAVYRKFAAHGNGMLDRGDYCWSRVKLMRDMQYVGYGLFDTAGNLEAYTFIHQARLENGKQHLKISDLAFVDGGAGKRLLSLLADFSMMADKVSLFGAVTNPLGAMLPLSSFTTSMQHEWMVRIIRFKDAIERRGYPRSVRAEFDVELTDDVVSENAGRWTVRIAEGSAKCAKSDGGARPCVRASIGGFAPVYTGYLTASAARIVGLIECDDDAAACVDGVFGPDLPSMVDFF